MTFLDSEYREIITKAICGKGRKLVKATDYLISSHKPSSILGCWLINHQYKAKKKSQDVVEIHGTYDINVWYSYEDNTKTEVVLEKITYCDEIVLSSKDENCLSIDEQVMAKVTKQPNCIQCKIDKDSNKISVDVEREFSVHVIGETKVCVRVESPNKPVEHK